ncbi:MAG: butyrate kinase [Bacteroidales bacterium]|nr:butyrate kinase [Bacteroidales bacterium]
MQLERTLILVINPRAVYTRVAIYENYNILFLKDIQHPDQELGRFSHISEQLEYRKKKILAELENNNLCMDCIKAVVGRGGLVKPVKSGIYKISKALIRDLKSSEYGEDFVDLGGLLANEIASELKSEVKAFIVDPVTVDEFTEFARFTGHPEFERKSIFHTLNQKAIARRHAKALMREYSDMKLIVVHLGSGISVSAHDRGHVVDSNQVLDGDGPFSPERTGSLPIGDVVRYCFNSGKTETEVINMLMHGGGLKAYLGTYSALEVDARVNHDDPEAIKVFGAMAYQVCKEIGSMYAVMESEIDGIIITGGIANSRWFVNEIIKRVEKMGPVHVYPGVRELDSMAQRALEALRDEVEVLEYK